MKQLRFMLIGMLMGILLFTGCTTSSPNPAEDEPLITPDISPDSTLIEKQVEYIRLSPAQAENMMWGDTIILDVRTQEEYDEGHIANAILLPDSEIKEKAETLLPDKKQTILVYCRSGNRSESASKALIDLGYENVYDFGGINDWRGEIVGHWLYSSYYNYFGDGLPQDIITPIDYVIGRQINEEMPGFVFYLTGRNVKKYGLIDNNTKYYIMSEKNEIEKITITDNTGAVIQQIENLVTENEATEEEMYGFYFDDWNFDGYLDIALWAYPGGTMRNAPHYYWLWDLDSGQFVENAELMDISDYAGITINAEEKQLECYTSLGMAGGVTQYVKYIDHKFVVVSSVQVEIVPSPDDENKDVRHIIVEELVDGEWITTQDYYEDVENIE